jgi:hypothetical protein
MFRRVLIVLFVALFALGDMSASIVFAQDAQQQQQPRPKRKTLFDMLFGNNNDQQDQVAPPPAVVKKPKKAALPVPAKPTVAKSPTATRLAVFGDSLATDVAAALDRFYQDDPNIVIINQAVGSSGFVRPDFFDWDKTAVDQVTQNTFDMAVMIVGINDRQTIKTDEGSMKALTPEWATLYQSRVAQFVQTIHSANKPLIWVGLPPMMDSGFSTAIGQISATQRLAAFSGGAEFIDIYDRFVDENGDYSSFGPDLNGNRVRMRKSDGIHFSAAGADKLAFYLSQTIKLYYHGGGSVGITVADVLAGTDAAIMVRPPYQGLGQTRLLEVAGAVIPLSQSPKRATDLVTAAATAPTDTAFDTTQMIDAPVGRVDDFGVGHDPQKPDDVGDGPGPAVPAAAVTPVAAN